MASVKPTLTRLSELADGQKGDFFALLAEKDLDVTSAGKPYYHCRFRDARRSASFMAWGDPGNKWYERCEKEWQVGRYYKVRAVYKDDPKYGPQIEIIRIREVNEEDRAHGFDESQLIETSRHDAAGMFGQLRTLAAKQIEDEPLQRLVLALLDRHAGAWQRLPATRDRAYAFVGGLLEHTLSVAHVALDLAERYASAYPELKPPLNRDLVVAGAILHDVGRVAELAAEGTPGAVLPTVPGRLVGPLVLGRDLVREGAREVPELSPELLGLLEHVLLSGVSIPPGEREGPQRAPLIPEALLVHQADDLDQKFELFARRLSRDHAQGPFTDRDPALGRHLLKGRNV
jgi:3'-5' exoribonuclease